MAGRRNSRAALRAAAPLTGVRVERLSHEGRGVARVEGKTVFVEGALPGETVSIRYTRRRGQFDEAEVVAIEQASPVRVEPPCQHATRCGGCSLQHLALPAQIAHKESVLLELLAHQAKVSPGRVIPPVTGASSGYRRRARMSVRRVEKKRGEVLIGFREKGSHFVTEIERCEVLVPAVGERILALRRLLGGLEAADHIPQLEVAAGDEEVAILVRHLVPLTGHDREALAVFGREQGLRVYAQPGNIDTLERLDAPDAPLRYAAPDLALEFQPGDFVQVNGSINQRVVPLALELLDVAPGDRVLDLFAGLGNFTLPLARRVAEVVGVEGDAGLVARAEANAHRLGLSNARFAAADLFSADGIAAIPAGPYQKVLLDPPRSGAADVVATLDFRAVERLCYVSCNPVTLARDAATLVHQQGFVLEAAGVLDMFPHTTHVESIALFTRR